MSLINFQKCQRNRRSSKPSGSRKVWREVIYHYSSFMKIDRNINKLDVSKNAFYRTGIRNQYSNTKSS